MSEALIAPSTLIWARQRAHLTIDRIAQKFAKIELWERGEARPTFAQAQKLATYLQVPFGYLFLPTPPIEELPIPDLRTLGSHPIVDISPDFRDLLNSISLKQQWYKEHLLSEGETPKPYLAKHTIQSGKIAIANDIISTLELTSLIGKNLDKKILLGKLADASENAGILVMKNGIVGNNTHKKLSIEEFRGFSIYDPIAPLVFINSTDAIAGQIFTLVHELVHLWIGEAGISSLDFEHTDNQIEHFCNAVTTEILIPKELMLANFDTTKPAQYQTLANTFSVSTLAILNRLYNLGLLSQDQRKTLTKLEQDNFDAQPKNESSKSGGDFYRTLKTKNGNLFSVALIASTLNGKTTYKEAASLLDTSIKGIDKYAKHLGVM